MNTTLLLVMSIIFIIGGAGFCGTAVYLIQPKNSDSFFCKVASRIFFVIGSITLVSGILGITFRNEVTRNGVALYATIYLLIITGSSLVFTIMLNKKK